METTKKIKSEYYQKNREAILQGMYRKVRCEACDTEIMFCNMPKHLRSRKHAKNQGVHENTEEQKMYKLFKEFYSKHQTDLKV